MGDHDKLFQRVFSVAEHAAGELRSVLPPELEAALDLDQLERVPGSFVDAALRERRTDLLFKAPCKANGASVYLYLLLEHQSRPDPLMPLRVLEYQVRIWGQLLRKEPGRRTLPPIVSLVVHHGESGWTAPRRLHELVEGIEELSALAPLVPDLGFLLDDLVSEEDAALLRRPLAPYPKVALFLMRDGRSLERFLQHLAAWGEELGRLALDGRSKEIVEVLRYTFRVVGEMPFDTLRRAIQDVAPEMEEPLATIEEQLIQRGVELGVEQGVERGERRGRAQGVRSILQRQMRLRFGPLSPEDEQRIQDASLTKLESWADRIMTAESLAEVFET